MVKSRRELSKVNAQGNGTEKGPTDPNAHLLGTDRSFRFKQSEKWDKQQELFITKQPSSYLL